MFDRAFAESFRFVRNNSIKIEIDGVAKPLTARASAIRIVERKQARLRLFISKIAVLALEALGEIFLERARAVLLPRASVDPATGPCSGKNTCSRLSGSRARMVSAT